jgi:sortase A
MFYNKRWLSPLGSLVVISGIVFLFGLGGCQSQRQPQVSQSPAGLRPTQVPTAALVPTATPVIPTVPPAPPTVIPTRPAATATPAAAAPLDTATQRPKVGPSPTTTSAAGVAPVPTYAAVSASTPVRLVVDLPGRKLAAPVVEMGWKVIQTADGPRSDWVIPKNEAGHHMNSAMLGEPGNLVISGHNNIYGQVFRPISLAWDDDTRIKVDNFTDESRVLDGRSIQLFDASGKQFNYTVTGFYRLKDTGVSLQQRIANARYMQPTDETQVTLITCWPPSSNTHRLVLIAKPAN